LKHLIVPKTNYTDTVGFQIFAPDSIAIPSIFSVVLTAIDLNGNLILEAEEVQDVAADPILPDEFQVHKTPVPKMSPQPSLGASLIDS
jgi:hypothetical protein